MPVVDVVNFRDLGGIEGVDGRRVLPKRLLRSGALIDVSAADKTTLVEEYELRRVVDFRTKTERDTQPDEIPEGVAYSPIDLFDRLEGDVPTHQAIFSKLTHPDQVDGFMKNAYTLLICEASAQKGYREYLELLLAQKTGATLDHCSAGKDRTGIAAAIVLTILGASKEDILADFLRTNESRKLANEQIGAILKAHQMSDTQIDAIKLAMYVKEEYLETAYAKAAELFGSFEHYIRDGLSVDKQMASRLRDMYLEV